MSFRYVLCAICIIQVLVLNLTTLLYFKTYPQWLKCFLVDFCCSETHHSLLGKIFLESIVLFRLSSKPKTYSSHITNIVVILLELHFE